MITAERTELMTVRDVAERCNISAVTVRRLIRNGDLPCIRVGNQLRFDRDQLEAWLTDQGGGSEPAARHARADR